MIIHNNAEVYGRRSALSVLVDLDSCLQTYQADVIPLTPDKDFSLRFGYITI